MSKKIPNYILNIDDNDEDSGLKAIAYTDTPAILKKGIYLSNIKSLTFTDKLLYQVAAPAIIPMSIYRLSNDLGEYTVEFTPDEILKMVKNFQKQKRTFNLDHNPDLQSPSYILYNWIIEDPKTDISFTKYGIQGLTKGTWFVVSQFTDKDYFMNEIVSKERTGYSVEGFFDLKRDFSEIKNVKKIVCNHNHNFDGETYPPIHPNCECSIVDGVWEFGENPCQLCQDAADSYNSMKKINKIDMEVNFQKINTEKGHYFVDGNIVIGSKVMTLSSNLDKEEIVDGTDITLLDNTILSIDKGLIFAIKPPVDEEEEQEEEQEAQDGTEDNEDEEDKKTDKTQAPMDVAEVLDEIPSVDPAIPMEAPEVKTISMEDVMNYMKPMMDDMTKKIAELQSSIEQSTIKAAPEQLDYKNKVQNNIGSNFAKILNRN